jgi:hypothetical protein
MRAASSVAPTHPSFPCERTRSQSRLRQRSPKSHRDARKVNSLPEQVTIIDPRHPLYGRTFPLLRTHSSRPNSRLVLILPNGHRRVVSRSVTDIDQPQSKQSPQPLISAATLLPLARYVRLKVLALEENTNDTKTEPKCGDPGDLILATTTTAYSTDNDLECPGRGSSGATDKHLAALIRQARKSQTILKEGHEEQISCLHAQQPQAKRQRKALLGQLATGGQSE